MRENKKHLAAPNTLTRPGTRRVSLAVEMMMTVSGCLATQHRRSSEPHLRILPSGRQEIRAGKNLVLTCRAQVPNIELVKQLRWINPRGQDIPQDDRWDHRQHHG